MSYELKACMNCGEQSITVQGGVVQCDSCFATIARDTDEQAIAAWNRRTVTREQVDKMADELREWIIDPRHRAHDVTLDMLRAAGFEVADG